MAKQVTMTKISTSRKLAGGQPICMYTFVIGAGKKTTSETRHMTEAQAAMHKRVIAG